MDIKILGISGSPIKEGNTVVFLAEALKAAEEWEGVSTELISLAGKDIRDCNHCNWCVSKQSEGNFCKQRDDMQDIFPKIVEADGLMLATPVYSTRLSGYMACFLDRWRIFGHGNHYKGSLKYKVGGALAVGWYRNLGMEAALLSIIPNLLIYGVIPVVPHLGLGAPGGAVGLSSEGGMGTFDAAERLGVLKDEYGLTSARNLSRKMVDVIKLVRAGKEALQATPAGR
ncbi:MAG: flavodoxin family protein [Dehalococcoidia bacterium]